MHVASAAPPGAPATSFQNVGLSGRTAGRTTTLRMRPSSLLHHTHTTRTYVRIISLVGSGPRMAGSHMAEPHDGHAYAYSLNSAGHVDLLVTTRAIAERGSRLAYGDGWIEDFLPEAVRAQGRLIPLRPPSEVPELADVDGALLRSMAVSSTPDLVPSLKSWLSTRYRGGDVTVVVDDYTR